MDFDDFVWILTILSRFWTILDGFWRFWPNSEFLRILTFQKKRSGWCFSKDKPLQYCKKLGLVGPYPRPHDFGWILTGFEWILNDFERVWMDLNDFDRFWMDFDQNWSILIDFVWILTILYGFERFWTDLNDFERILTDFDNFEGILNDLEWVLTVLRGFWTIGNGFWRCCMGFNRFWAGLTIWNIFWSILNGFWRFWMGFDQFWTGFERFWIWILLTTNVPLSF